MSTFINNVRKCVIAIVGTTGVGKSELGVQLAKTLKGEVVNGDSMQVIGISRIYGIIQRKPSNLTFLAIRKKKN